MLHNTYHDRDNLWGQYKRLKYVPFNPVDKFTMAVVEDKQTGKVRGCWGGGASVDDRPPYIDRPPIMQRMVAAVRMWAKARAHNLISTDS